MVGIERVMKDFHVYLTKLENDKKAGCFRVNLLREEQLLGFCIRIKGLLDIEEIKTGIGFSKSCLDELHW